MCFQFFFPNQAALEGFLGKDLEMMRFGTCRKRNFKDRLVVNGEATEICFLLAFARSSVWVLVRK